MKRFIYFFFFLFFASCSAPEQNPELKDKIYLDIQSKMSDADKSISDLHLNIQTEEKNLTGLDIQSVQRGSIKRKIAEFKNQITRLEQEKQYLKVRLIDRKVVVREKSLKNFYNKDPENIKSIEDDYSDYSKINDLKARPLNYSQKRRISEVFNKKEAPKHSESK